MVRCRFIETPVSMMQRQGKQKSIPGPTHRAVSRGVSTPGASGLRHQTVTLGHEEVAPGWPSRVAVKDPPQKSAEKKDLSV